MRLTSLCLLGLLLLDCRPDDPPHTPVYEVPAEIEPFVQAFRDEAAKRGKTLKIDDLIVEFGETSGQDICGVSQVESNKTPRITLVREWPCWTRAYKETQEGLVFHHLAHSVLGRGHKKTLLPNGDFASLMNGEDLGVYSPCIYPIGNTPCNLTGRRTYYLDELFNENTPVPAWGK
ncbi:hypothetical protein GCM10023189_50590 [Nibrella saemangeumensis]|uniref:Lipoprotein n=1 Tax=Nibrella saemangeumensis TaxID=1084526 RepID=A0ABP8NLA9_9BACT